MSKLKISEDWTSTIVGWFIILLVVFQLKPHWPSFSWPDADALMNKIFTLDNVGHALIVFCFMFLMALIAGLFTGKKLKMIVASFPVVFFLTLLAMVVGGNKFLKDWGFETVIFSLLIGLFISNIFSIPKWLKESLSSELFVKIGLVLLGTTVLFDDLLKAGALGLIQSCVVVFTVWNFCFWLCRKMKIDKENVIDAFQCCFHLWCVCGCCYCRSYQGGQNKIVIRGIVSIGRGRADDFDHARFG